MAQQCKAVLIFNKKGDLICIAPSVNAACRLTGVPAGNISNVCNGKNVSAKGRYFRFPAGGGDTKINELVSLTLRQHDEAAGTRTNTKRTMTRGTSRASREQKTST